MEVSFFLFLIYIHTSNFKIFFLITLIIGIFIVLSSSSWFIIWIGLELNLISFIPLLSSKINIYSSEASLKYFLIQALGSITILSVMPFLFFNQNLFSAYILLAILLKIGARPLHLWFPMVLQGVNWSICFLLSTVQKIAPIALLIHLNTTYWNQSIIFLSSVLSAVIGAVSALNQTLLRKLMAFSSINHLGWMLRSIYINFKLWLYYFIVYIIITVTVFYIFEVTQSYHINQLSQVNVNPKDKLILYLSILSLGGLPPFLGFLPKLLIIKTLINHGMIFWLRVLITRALIRLFFYLRIIISRSAFYFSAHRKKFSNFFKKSFASVNIFFIYSNAFFLIAPTFFNIPI